MMKNNWWARPRTLKKKTKSASSSRAFVSTLVACFAVLLVSLVLMQASLIHNIDDDSNVRGSIKIIDPRFATQLTRPLGGTGTSQKGATVVSTGDGCECDIVSIDCLDSIKCLPSTTTESMQLMALGVTTRQLLKQMTHFEWESETFFEYPWGKGFQYGVIGGYNSWKRELLLPVGMNKRESTIFVNETWYPYCRLHHIKGKACFLGELEADEELDEMEMNAISTINIPNSTKEQISSDLHHFYHQSRSKDTEKPLPALGYLLLFAHIARIHFHRNPPVLEFYQARKTSVENVKQQEQEPSPLRVSVHLRRADSCNHKREGYEMKASELDSVAQFGGNRVCYDTSVYMNALKRAQQESNRPVEVYLSTDDAGSVMDEIQKKFPDMFQSMNWHYLDYARDTFQYVGAVEGDEIEASQQAMLGESAIADLWHMSHGEVFIGHLGSRFGKVSWLLATGRYNRFIPFFTVDGHSFCCEIDEQCFNMKKYITDMDSCMTFAAELSEFRSNEDYWQVGSMVRKMEAEKKKKKAKTKKKETKTKKKKKTGKKGH